MRRIFGTWMKHNEEQDTSENKDNNSKDSSNFHNKLFSFNSRMSQNSHNDSKNKNEYARNLKGYSKNVTHRFLNFLAFPAKKRLKNQQIKSNTIPDANTAQLVLSTLASKGERTIAPKTTWPALSKILDSLSTSSLVKIGSLGKIIAVDFIYVDNNIDNFQFSSF